MASLEDSFWNRGNKEMMCYLHYFQILHWLNYIINKKNIEMEKGKQASYPVKLS